MVMPTLFYFRKLIYKEGVNLAEAEKRLAFKSLNIQQCFYVTEKTSKFGQSVSRDTTFI